MNPAETVLIEPAEDPHWLRDALAIPFIEKIRSMGRALAFFVRRPRAFGEAWFRGDKTIPNPLVAMATSVPIVTLISQESARHLKFETAPRTLLAGLGETLDPYVVYIGAGLVAHAGLRLLGSRRNLRTTVGISLLSGAGTGAVFAPSFAIPVLALAKIYGSVDVANTSAPDALKLALLGGIFGGYLYFLFLFQFALAGAHGLPRWKAVIAGMIAVAAMAFACGWADNTTWVPAAAKSFGPHPSAYFGPKGFAFSFKW
jgi:hypothetical protein